MSDAWTVALAAAVAAGAVSARPLVPLAMAASAAALALVARRPALLCAGAATLASVLGARAEAGLRPPESGPVAGSATLVTDPVTVRGAVRAEVRLGRRRLDAWARGDPARLLRARLAGERVRLRGRLEPLPEAVRARLAHRHVAARLSVEGVDGWDAGRPLARLANGLRRTLLEGAAPLPERQRSLFAGLVLGDDRAQPPEVVDEFRAAGLTHLLAVSGQNVAFALMVVAPALAWLGLRGRLVAGLAVLVVFGTLTRWEPSVVRAAAMAGLVMVAATLGRPQPTLRVLALAVAGLVLVDPLLVRSVGFLLSVGACAGIALLAPALTGALPLPGPLATALGVTLAAQVGVAPVAIPLFGGLPVASLAANLLAVPAAGPVVAWGLTGGLLAGLAGPPLAGLLHLPTRLLVGWVGAVAAWAARLPLGEVGAGHALAIAVLGAVGVLVARPRLRLAAAGAMAGVLALPSLSPGPQAALDAEVAGGLRLSRWGGATVVVVEDPGPVSALGTLRRLRVVRADVLVATRTSSPALGPLVRRLRPRLLLAPPGHRIAGAVTARTGDRLAVGALVLEVERSRPLRVMVQPGASAGQRARAPPERFAGVRLGSPAVRLALGSRVHDLTTRVLVMGILNRTTDSFFDHGAYWDFDAFLRRAEQAVSEGADLLDVGGVKAGPGPEVSAPDELDRVVPAVEALVARFDVPVSVDTWRAAVAAAAFEAGAVMGNDISGFSDPDYLPVAAAAGTTVVATHIRLLPRVPDPAPRYGDVVADVRAFLAAKAARAVAAGVAPERIVVDAGLDLGKTWQQSLVLLRRSDRLADLGYPLLLSASNKTFLGRLLDLDVGERREASVAAHALGVARGCRLLRAHDVRAARRVADVVSAVLEAA